MKYFLICILLITGIETGVYWHYDSLLKSPVETASAKTSKPVSAQNVDNSQTDNNIILAANDSVNQIAISENHQLAAYVDNQNDLHIVNLTDKSVLYSTPESDQIVYLKWIRDDSVFIGLKGQDNSLTLKTFQVGSQQDRTIETFDGVTSTSTFKSIVYSPYTNDVYILIGNKTITRMYHINTNGHMYAMDLNHSFIQKPMMLATKNELFYQDVYDNIWVWDNGSTTEFKSNAVPLAAYDDSFYYGILNDQGRVASIYVYSQGNRQKVEDLSTPVHSNNIVVNSDGSIMILQQNSYYNSKTDKTIPLSSDIQAYVDDNSLFYEKGNKTYFVQG